MEHTLQGLYGADEQFAQNLSLCIVDLDSLIWWG